MTLNPDPTPDNPPPPAKPCRVWEALEDCSGGKDAAALIREIVNDLRRLLHALDALMEGESGSSPVPKPSKKSSRQKNSKKPKKPKKSR